MDRFYKIFEIIEEELIYLSLKLELVYWVFFLIEVFRFMIRYYFVEKFNVFCNLIVVFLDVKLVDIEKFLLIEWLEMILYVKVEII